MLLTYFHIHICFVNFLIQLVLYFLSTNSSFRPHLLTQQATKKSKRFRMALTGNVFRGSTHKRQNSPSDVISYFLRHVNVSPRELHVFVFLGFNKFTLFALHSNISVFNFSTDHNAEPDKFLPIFTCTRENES